MKLLGNGELKKKLTVRVHGISATAREKVEQAGGTVSLLKEPKVKKRKKHAKVEAGRRCSCRRSARGRRNGTDTAPEAENVAPEPDSTEEQAPEVE